MTFTLGVHFAFIKLILTSFKAAFSPFLYCVLVASTHVLLGDTKVNSSRARGQILNSKRSFTHLPLVLLLVLLTESELEERLREPDPLLEHGGRVAWLASL